jgi:hypothetical protein
VDAFGKGNGLILAVGKISQSRSSIGKHTPSWLLARFGVGTGNDGYAASRACVSSHLRR